VAIVGCGRIMQTAHLPVWRDAARAGRCEIVGVADRDLARATTVGASVGVPAFGSLDELLAATRPDIVHVATLLDTHRDLTVAALRAGCHVLCEKPIASDATQAAEMVAAAEAAGRILSICFQSRAISDARYLHDFLASGSVGAVLSVRTWGTDVRGMPVNRQWPHPGGGVLSHFTSHNLDLALWLLGYPRVRSVSAIGWHRINRMGVDAVPMAAGIQDVNAVPADIEDTGYAFLRLDHDALVTVEANFLARPASRQTGYEILAERGAGSLFPLEVWRDDGDRWTDITPATATRTLDPWEMTGLIDEFLVAVATGGPAPVRGSEIVALQRAMDAIYESVRTRTEVSI
jgi:predicted dehydrogenase